jgi:glycosyltransferase involved in cell wall biosynthesis
MISEKRLTIFIMSYNRPEFLSEALDSVLNQTYKSMEVILSDNSTDNRVEKLMSLRYPKVKYIKRTPSLDVLSHHNALIDDVKTEFVTFFHDDDILEAGYAEKLTQLLVSNENLSAVASDARLIFGGSRSKIKFGNLEQLEIIENGQQLLKRYFDFGAGYPPFPGYMYRTSRIKNKRLIQEYGGRHSDYTFLDGVLESGPIAWSDQTLMSYRLHQGSSGVSEILSDRRKLVQYLVKKYNLSRNDEIIKIMRFKFLLSWYRKKGLKKRILARKLIKMGLLFFLFNTKFRISILKKIFNKPSKLFN